MRKVQFVSGITNHEIIIVIITHCLYSEVRLGSPSHILCVFMHILPTMHSLELLHLDPELTTLGLINDIKDGISTIGKLQINHFFNSWKQWGPPILTRNCGHLLPLPMVLRHY